MTTPEDHQQDGHEEPRPSGDAPTPSGLDEELRDLARTHVETEERAQRLVADRVLVEARNGGPDDAERSRQLVPATRRDLLAELRAQEQEQARHELRAAAHSSEDAVTGAVQGVTTIMRSLVPAVLVRPEAVIETGFALADQGLRVARRLALGVVGGMRGLVTD